MAIARVLRRRSCAALTVLGRAANSRESSACRAAEEAAANVSRPRSFSAPPFARLARGPLLGARVTGVKLSITWPIGAVEAAGQALSESRVVGDSFKRRGSLGLCVVVSRARVCHICV